MPSKRATRERTARRTTLRTLVDRVKSSRRRARKAAAPSAAGTRRARVSKRRSTLAPRTVVVGTLCVVAAAALVMSRNSSVVNWVAEVDATGQVQKIERVEAFDPAQTTAPVRRVETPDAEPTIVAASLRSTGDAADQQSATSSVSEEVPALGPVTITGCLERDDAGFSLTDVSGDDAPKARSWKSGFLRKRSSSVALVDRGYTQRLASYVGQRVETTGILEDREMRVRAVRVLGSCE